MRASRRCTPPPPACKASPHGSPNACLLACVWHSVQADFHPYSARGDPAALLQGDFYAGKGVGWASLDAPAGRLSVFNVSLLPQRRGACHARSAPASLTQRSALPAPAAIGSNKGKRALLPPLLPAPQTHLSANYGQRWQWGAPGLPPECRLPRDSLAGVRLLQARPTRRPGGQGCRHALRASRCMQLPASRASVCWSTCMQARRPAHHDVTTSPPTGPAPACTRCWSWQRLWLRGAAGPRAWCLGET